MVAPTSEPVVIFDGYCHLCDGTVRFLLRRDHRRRLRFAASQSPAGAALLARFPHRSDADDTLFLVEGDRLYERSTAALRIARHLGFPWRALTLLLAVPRPLRDAVYRFVARRRYRWFGRRDTCRLPTPDERARFLE